MAFIQVRELLQFTQILIHFPDEQWLLNLSWLMIMVDYTTLHILGLVDYTTQDYMIIFIYCII